MHEAPVTPADAPVAPAVAPRRPRSPLAVAAAVLALALAVLAVLAGFGSRWGWWHFRTGFDLLRWSVYGAIATMLLSLVALVVTRPGASRRGFPLALFALLVGMVVALVPWSWQQKARSVPPIHDISTDLNNPPAFVAVAPLRADAPNPMEYGGPEIAAQQREAYPDLQPLVLDLPRERAFQRALDSARGMGWEIVAADPAAGRIEATDQTFWFGFKDDVVIRLTPLGSRTVLDVRSLSRVGGSDVGANAERIREYLAEVR
jgi:uncharacterized protein (DUF1499 family)